MAIIVRVMLVQLTNAADAERYFSWHKNLLGNLRHNIDIDSTLKALSVIKYNSDTEELQNDIVPETIKLFEKSYIMRRVGYCQLSILLILSFVGN